MSFESEYPLDRPMDATIDFVQPPVQPEGVLLHFWDLAQIRYKDFIVFYASQEWRYTFLPEMIISLTEQFIDSLFKPAATLQKTLDGRDIPEEMEKLRIELGFADMDQLRNWVKGQLSAIGEEVLIYYRYRDFPGRRR